MSEPVHPRLPIDWRSAGSVLRGLLGRLIRIKLLWIIAGVWLGIYVLGSSCSTYVPPNMIGIRQVYFGSGAGIKPESYQPGLHFIVGGVERLHLFPRDLQVINFSSSSSEQSQQSRQADSIKIQTSDGYNVQLDVTLIYRIKDPYHVFTEAGPGRAFEDRLVIPRADRILRKTLGELNSEEFYQGPTPPRALMPSSVPLRTLPMSDLRATFVSSGFHWIVFSTCPERADVAWGGGAEGRGPSGPVRRGRCPSALRIHSPRSLESRTRPRRTGPMGKVSCSDRTRPRGGGGRRKNSGDRPIGRSRRDDLWASRWWPA